MNSHSLGDVDSLSAEQIFVRYVLLPSVTKVVT